MKNLVLLLLIVCFLNPAYSVAENYNPIDPSEFDISGIKLGMSEREAVEAVIHYYGISEKDISFHRENKKNIITGKKEVKFFNVKQDQNILTVHFALRIPVDKARPLTVYYIRYALPVAIDNRKAKLNFEALKKAAFQKYGEPSNSGDSFTKSFKWCLKERHDPNMPILKLDSTQLFLQDMSFLYAATEYSRKEKVNSMKLKVKHPQI